MTCLGETAVVPPNRSIFFRRATNGPGRKPRPGALDRQSSLRLLGLGLLGLAHLLELVQRQEPVLVGVEPGERGVGFLPGLARLLGGVGRRLLGVGLLGLAALRE